MPQICRTCSHPKRQEIESLIIQGRSINSVAQQYGLNQSALNVHTKRHLATNLSKVREARELDLASKNLRNLNRIIKETWDLFAQAKQSEDIELTLFAIDRVVKQIEVMHKLTEKAAQQAVNINILQLNEWRFISEGLLRALDAYPEAQRAVLNYLANTRDELQNGTLKEAKLLPAKTTEHFEAAMEIAKQEMDNLQSVKES
jgi:hypothetical protein